MLLIHASLRGFIVIFMITLFFFCKINAPGGFFFFFPPKRQVVDQKVEVDAFGCLTVDLQPCYNPLKYEFTNDNVCEMIILMTLTMSLIVFLKRKLKAMVMENLYLVL